LLEEIEETVAIKPITMKKLWHLKIDTVPLRREGKRRTGTLRLERACD